MEHEWMLREKMSGSYEYCRLCQIVRRKDGKNKSCPGIVEATTRDNDSDDDSGAISAGVAIAEAVVESVFDSPSSPDTSPSSDDWSGGGGDFSGGGASGDF